MEKLYYQNKHVKIYYEDEVDTGLARWEGFVAGTDYRNALNAANELFKEMRTNKWVANLSGMASITEEDQKWSNEVWFPTALSLGLRRIAIVVGTDIFNKMNVEDIMNRVDDLNLVSRYFDSEAAALAWIGSEASN